MTDFILSCCGSADLSKQHLIDRNINYIGNTYFLDGVAHTDDLGETMPFPKFYKLMADGAMTSTSQVSVGEFIDYFTEFLKQGKDILHVALSSGISGVYQSALAAREELIKQFPERKISIVDSLAASSGYGLFMDKLADLRDDGMGIDALTIWANKYRLNVHHWFFSTDLTYYVRGGRVSKVSGWFGTILNICPLLNMDNKGRLIPRYKLRGKKKVIDEIVKQMTIYARGGTDYNGKCYISHSDCLDDAKEVQKLVERTFPHINGGVELNNIGTTIGSHTGPGTVALFFFGSKR